MLLIPPLVFKGLLLTYLRFCWQVSPHEFFKLTTLKIFMYLLLIFLPLIGSLCAGLFGRKLGPFGASYITVSCLILTFLMSLFAFYEVALLNCCVYIKLAPWINSEILHVD
jgi:cytochrome b561